MAGACDPHTYLSCLRHKVRDDSEWLRFFRFRDIHESRTWRLGEKWVVGKEMNIPLEIKSSRGAGIPKERKSLLSCKIKTRNVLLLDYLKLHLHNLSLVQYLYSNGSGCFVFMS